jgi:pimeloyl-ACP methyl ester carboxylesterase
VPTLTTPTGQRIAYDDTGGSGLPVVLSHGILMDRSMFDAQVEALRADHRVVTWDQRGHGQTPADEPFTYWDSARDLIALLDALGIDRAVLGGMSQGGFVSLRAALLAPERVSALVLMDTQAGLELPGAGEAYLSLAEDWAANGPKPGVPEFAASMIIGPGEHPTWVAKWVSRPHQDVLYPFRALVSREDLHEHLAEITVPALVIHGEADAAIPLERAQALAAGLPGARDVHLVAGAPHAANMTHPDEVNAAIRAFLADVR